MNLLCGSFCTRENSVRKRIDFTSCQAILGWGVYSDGEVKDPFPYFINAGVHLFLGPETLRILSICWLH